MNKVGHLVLLGAACALLVGCGAGNATPGITATTPPVQTATTTPTQPTTDATPSQTDTSDPAAMLGWVGQYSFGEVTSNANLPPSTAMGYGIVIYQMGTGFFAAINISGNNATQAITATVQGDATSITLYFDSFIGTNPWKNVNYKPGDALLTLDSKDGQITTTWVTMQPQVAGNKSPGSHFSMISPSPTATQTS